MRSSRSGPRLLALTAGLAVTLLACSGATPTTAPTVATPTQAATASSATISLIPTPAATANPIPDGTYRSGPNAVAKIIAALKADKTMSATLRDGYLQGFTGHTTDVVSISFQYGLFTEADALDGAPPQGGARGTYAFPDAHTLVIQEDCCGLSTLTIISQPSGFSLKYKSGAPNAGEDVVGQWLYETSPFTLVP